MEVQHGTILKIRVLQPNSDLTLKINNYKPTPSNTITCTYSVKQSVSVPSVPCLNNATPYWLACRMNCAKKRYTITCNINIHSHTHTYINITAERSWVILQNYRQIELVHWTQFLLIFPHEGGRPLGNNNTVRKARKLKCFTHSLLYYICSNLSDFSKWTLKAQRLPKLSALSALHFVKTVYVFIRSLRIEWQQ
jgi:hypothetical protein